MHTAKGKKIWLSVQSRNFGCDKNFHDTIPRVNKIPIINDKLNGSKWFETQSHIIGRVYFTMFTNVYDVNIPNHSNYNHTFCECLMCTLDAKLLIQQEKINLLLSEFPASILDGVIVVLLWGIFSGFNWASTLLIRCFICRAFSQRMKEHNIKLVHTSWQNFHNTTCRLCPQTFRLPPATMSTTPRYFFYRKQEQ